MIRFMDPAGRLQLVNRHWEKVLGWSLAEVHQNRDIWAEFYPDAGDRQRALEFRRHSGGVWGDFKTRVRDGRILDTSWASVLLSDGMSIGIGLDVTERRRTEQMLQEYVERLQTLSRRLLEVQEAERHHLARELHDEVGQLLTGLRLLLKPEGHSSADALGARLEQARDLVDELLARVRGLSFDLRPAVLDQLGLVPALLALFERFTEQTSVLVAFRQAGADQRFAPEMETTAYRIVQEALTNVARHAGVAGATVRVWSTTDLLNVQIEDRGRGFEPEVVLATPRCDGLSGMRERVRLLDGDLTIHSTLGAGTQITAGLPLLPPGRKQGVEDRRGKR
jgi:PAS domain S-box-containing protein